MTTRKLSSLFACALAVSACGVEGEDETWDEGPLDDIATSGTEDIDVELTPEELAEIAAAGSPRFQLPFPCGQVWLGETRVGHSPQLAVDFNRTNDLGDVVVAAASGTVTVVGNTGSDSYGRWIEIGHGNGVRTRYAHLSAQAVSVGQRVRRGQRIGRVGSTGGSSGPHLHYEMRRNGVAVRARFNGNDAFYFGDRNYRSNNCQ